MRGMVNETSTMAAQARRIAKSRPKVNKRRLGKTTGLKVTARRERFLIAMAGLPLIAILRGVKPSEAVAIGEVLVEAGFLMIETPLNSPGPMQSIALLRKHLPSSVIVGAGTALSVADVERTEQAGGELVVMPHADVAVIRAAEARGLICLPGVATPTEAFAALNAGAAGLKAFPAEMITPAVLKAWRAVIPKDTLILPVGGVSPDTMAAYFRAGASGFGLGSALYRPGDAPAAVAANAKRFVDMWRTLKA